MLKVGVIASLNLPEKSMQRRIVKPCVTNSSFYSSSGSELFTSSSTQSEKKKQKTFTKLLKNFVNEHVISSCQVAELIYCDISDPSV